MEESLESTPEQQQLPPQTTQQLRSLDKQPKTSLQTSEQEQHEVGDITQSELEIYIKEFMDKYFDEVNRVVEFNMNFLVENGFEEPKIDYTRLKRFIDAAINNLKNVQMDIMDGLSGKLYGDINKLYDFVSEFKRQTLVNKAIYKRDFLGQLKPYLDLQGAVEKTEAFISRYEAQIAQTDAQIKAMGTPKGLDEINTYKMLKKKNIDAIHHASEEKERATYLRGKLLELEKRCEDEFFVVFEERKKFYNKALQSIINTKTYYLNALIWSIARKNENVKKFFKDARIEAEIGLKAYLQYYLKGINAEMSKNAEWHAYLKEVMPQLD